MAVRTLEMKEMTRLHSFPAKKAILFLTNRNSLNKILIWRSLRFGGKKYGQMPDEILIWRSLRFGGKKYGRTSYEILIWRSLRFGGKKYGNHNSSGRATHRPNIWRERNINVCWRVESGVEWRLEGDGQARLTYAVTDYGLAVKAIGSATRSAAEF